jgi:undecaprenyl-diphosphatase
VTAGEGADVLRPAARARSAAACAAAASAAFVALTAAVLGGAVTDVDARLAALGRPDRVWGPVQAQTAPLVDALGPSRSVSALAALTLMVCAARRSVRPAVPAVLGVVLAGPVMVVAKVLIARPDPGDTVWHGGSFPSGHTASLVVCSGLAVLVLRPDGARWRWWWLLPAAAGVVMGVALVVIGAHWATDCLGGELLGLAVLAAVQAVAGPRLGAQR